MRYVTFYYSILGGLRDKVVHSDMPTALRHFKRHFRDYFQLNTPFNPTSLPASYGFAHRRFYGMSIREYNKNWRGREGASA